MSMTALPTVNGELSTENMEVLAGMVNKEDIVGRAPSIPVLKVNSRIDSQVCKPGEFVVGQKVEDGNITEQGQQVEQIVILIARERYNYYNAKNTTLNCNSKMFSRNSETETIIGSRLQHECGPACPLRAKDRPLNDKCSCGFVLYAKAMTSTGLVDCVMYAKGTSYMPMADYLGNSFYIKGKNGYTSVPMYAFITNLASEMKVNGSVTYWVIHPSRGGMLTLEDIDKLSKDYDSVYEHIEQQRRNFDNKLAQANPLSQGQQAPSFIPQSIQTIDAQPAQPAFETQPVPASMDAAPWDSQAGPEQAVSNQTTPNQATPGQALPEPNMAGMDDIEAKIAAALNQA